MTNEKIKEWFLETCKQQQVCVQVDINGVLFGEFLATDALALFAAGISLGEVDHALHMEF